MCKLMPSGVCLYLPMLQQTFESTVPENAQESLTTRFKLKQIFFFQIWNTACFTPITALKTWSINKYVNTWFKILTVFRQLIFFLRQNVNNIPQSGTTSYQLFLDSPLMSGLKWNGFWARKQLNRRHLDYNL